MAWIRLVLSCLVLSRFVMCPYTVPSLSFLVSSSFLLSSLLFESGKNYDSVLPRIAGSNILDACCSLYLRSYSDWERYSIVPLDPTRESNIISCYISSYLHHLFFIYFYSNSIALVVAEIFFLIYDIIIFHCTGWDTSISHSTYSVHSIRDARLTTASRAATVGNGNTTEIITEIIFSQID